MHTAVWSPERSLIALDLLVKRVRSALPSVPGPLIIGTKTQFYNGITGKLSRDSVEKDTFIKVKL
jgi:hypothetical protein